eukprot:gene6293-biopygen5346
MANSDPDHGLLGLVDRLLRKPERRDSTVVKAAPADDGLGPAVPVAALPSLLEPQLSAEAARTCTPAEMADIILRALRTTEGCPQQGFEISIYGSSPWNAMLRITPAAGPVANPTQWRTRVRDMVPVLRGQFDVVDQADPPAPGSAHETLATTAARI